MKFVSFLETPVSFYGHLLSAATKKICIFGIYFAKLSFLIENLDRETRILPLS